MSEVMQLGMFSEDRIIEDTPKDKKFCGVYFAQGRSTLRVKIGISKDVRGRIRQVKHGASEGVVLFGTIETGDIHRARELEKFFHMRYRAYRKKGEWFEIPHEEIEKDIALIAPVLFILSPDAWGINWYFTDTGWQHINSYAAKEQHIVRR